MRVLVTGGRDYSSYEDRMWLYAGLSMLHDMDPITELIEGGAQGFDRHAMNWVLWRKACGDKITHTHVEAEWTKYGRGAGPIRNAVMAKMGPDVVLACPGGFGTANMITVAKAYRLRVIYLKKMPVVRTEKDPLGVSQGVSADLGAS